MCGFAGEASARAEGGSRQSAQVDQDGGPDDPREQEEASQGPAVGPHQLSKQLQNSLGFLLSQWGIITNLCWVFCHVFFEL